MFQEESFQLSLRPVVQGVRQKPHGDRIDPQEVANKNHSIDVLRVRRKKTGTLSLNFSFSACNNGSPTIELEEKKVRVSLKKAMGSFSNPILQWDLMQTKNHRSTLNSLLNPEKLYIAPKACSWQLRSRTALAGRDRSHRQGSWGARAAL